MRYTTDNVQILDGGRTVIEVMKKNLQSSYRDAVHLQCLIEELGMEWNGIPNNAVKLTGEVPHIRPVDGYLRKDMWWRQFGGQLFNALDAAGRRRFQIAVFGHYPGKQKFYIYDEMGHDADTRYTPAPELVHCFIDAPHLTGVWLERGDRVFDASNAPVFKKRSVDTAETSLRLHSGLTSFVSRLARSSTADSERAALLSDEHPWIRHLAAVTAGDSTKALFVGDPDPSVRMGVAQSAHSDALRLQFLTDRDPAVRRIAVEHMHGDREREMFCEDPDASVIEGLLRTANDDALRIRIAKNGSPEIRTKALEFARTDECRSIFLADPDADIRKKAVKSISSITVLGNAIPGLDGSARRLVRMRIHALEHAAVQAKRTGASL